MGPSGDDCCAARPTPPSPNQRPLRSAVADRCGDQVEIMLALVDVHGLRRGI